MCQDQHKPQIYFNQHISTPQAFHIICLNNNHISNVAIHRELIIHLLLVVRIKTSQWLGQRWVCILFISILTVRNLIFALGHWVYQYITLKYWNTIFRTTIWFAYEWRKGKTISKVEINCIFHRFNDANSKLNTMRAKSVITLFTFQWNRTHDKRES